MSDTNIEYANVTDNIIRVVGGGYWCRKLSAGCEKCYAEKINQNPFFGGNKLEYKGVVPELELNEYILKSWSRMRKTKIHFVSSMTDIFGEWVPYAWHEQMLDAMIAAPNQIFLLFTKRTQVMKDVVSNYLLARNDMITLPENIWCGTTIENRKTLELRAPILNQTPALCRFWSVEPLLEDLEDIREYLTSTHWIILGGESGSGARGCNTAWFSSIIKQAKKYHEYLPIFVKQLGANPYTEMNVKNCETFVNNGGKNSNNLNYSYYHKYEKLEFKNSKGGDIEEWGAELNNLKLRELPKNFPIVFNKKSPVRETLYIGKIS